MAQHDPDRATAREDLCRFLAACYYEPDPAFAEERLFDSMIDAAQRIDPALGAAAQRLGAAFAAHDLQTLLVDYTRLFLGPVSALARPYGSVWLGGDAQQAPEATLAVLELYREGGFDIDEGLRELPDHVAVELEFLYVLLFNAHRALREGRSQDAATAERLLRRLLDEHLGAWIGRFAAAVKAGAETPFYRELAELTERFVAMQRAGIA